MALSGLHEPPARMRSAMALELGPFGILVNGVAPGSILTMAVAACSTPRTARSTPTPRACSTTLRSGGPAYRQKSRLLADLHRIFMRLAVVVGVYRLGLSRTWQFLWSSCSAPGWESQSRSSKSRPLAGQLTPGGSNREPAPRCSSSMRLEFR